MGEKIELEIDLGENAPKLIVETTKGSVFEKELPDLIEVLEQKTIEGNYLKCDRCYRPATVGQPGRGNYCMDENCGK